MPRLTAARSPLTGSRSAPRSLSGLSRLGATPGLAPAGKGAPRQVEKRERPSARARGYSAKWDKASRAFLDANPFCRGCQALGRQVPSTLTDHVIPHRGDLKQFWRADWWQASCEWHHNAVKQELERQRDERRIEIKDLWLDSAVAVSIARRFLGRAGAREGVG